MNTAIIQRKIILAGFNRAGPGLTGQVKLEQGLKKCYDYLLTLKQSGRPGAIGGRPAGPSQSAHGALSGKEAK
jgi:hypothetical protein